jgi:hypothetical protein
LPAAEVDVIALAEEPCPACRSPDEWWLVIRMVGSRIEGMRTATDPDACRADQVGYRVIRQ